MPDYVWEFICHSELDDGEYPFPEGTVVVKNGYAGWIPKEEEPKKTKIIRER